MQQLALGGPQLGWLFLSDDDIQQAERLIASMKEEDAADAMGLRPIADLVAEWLYPALTTPMTHARYFIFLPTLFRQLEQQRHRDVKAVRDAAKRLQHGLVGPLGPVKGNIGRRAAADLNRWPATIYWNGLRSLGILQRPFSEGRYYSHLVRHSSQTWTSEDGILHEEGGHCWDERCPNVPLSRPSKKSTNGRRLTFELTRREAEYLRRRFETVNGYNESLMKCRLEAEADHDPKDPWDVRASGVLGRRLRHAERLSSIGMGLLLVYTHRMHRVRRESEQSDEVWNCYLEWQETAKRSLRTWDVAQFRSLLLASGFTKARSDTDFLEHVRDVVCGPKGRSLQPISDVVQARELTRRSAKCRLCGHPDHRRYLKQWRAPKELSGAYVFPYRHHIGTTVVREIREGLQRRV